MAKPTVLTEITEKTIEILEEVILEDMIIASTMFAGAASATMMGAAFMPTPAPTINTQMPTPDSEKMTTAETERELEENISALWAHPARFLN